MRKPQYLNKQVYVYNVDTAAFYTEEEQQINAQIHQLENEKKVTATSDRDKRKSLNAKVKALKSQLRTSFDTYAGTRTLRPEKMKDTAIISLFESNLTRTLGVKPGDVTKDIIVVETYFHSVLDSLIAEGFEYMGVRYICFTASAGQTRNKKTVFITQAAWELHHGTLTAGLSIEEINVQGGANVNKYLAYLALSNSVTEEWHGFDISRAIVVDDMELPVDTTVDYIDSEDFSITRKQMPVTINHTDGCGMILPKLSRNAFMVRLPWIKGLLVPFPFDKFAREQGSSVVRDIYGKEWDILRDKIEIIFTKSQFKMWRYYQNWDDYITRFLANGCKAGKRGEEPARIRRSKTNYQIIQTLPDLTDDELRELAREATDDIRNIGSDRDTMLKVLGVRDSDKTQSYYQQALAVYPELLADAYSRQLLKQVKKKIVTRAHGGTFKIDGVYTYIIPDLYAFCEWLFLGCENPSGLLRDGEVSCRIYSDGERLDCLRSPHLYREHAVRTNKVDANLRKWFKTRGVYTSCHDAISKLLMFDCDGDKALVVRDKTLVAVAERNMADIVPLYYEMKTATKEIITPAAIYKGLEAAYKGGNIGIVSNTISKIWNSGQVDIDAIKILCCISNFTIDYAKTLYKPTIPDGIQEKLSAYEKVKLPHFFRYAKDKEASKVAPLTDSPVNRLSTIVKDVRINFSAANLGHFNYQTLMKNKRVSIKTEEARCIIEKYKAVDTSKYKMSAQLTEEREDSFVYASIRKQLLEINADINYVTDVLVKYLYVERESNYKTTLWSCLGDVILRNIQRNLDNKLDDGYILCADCGSRTQLMRQRQTRCTPCHTEYTRERKREGKRKEREGMSPRVTEKTA